MLYVKIRKLLRIFYFIIQAVLKWFNCSLLFIYFDYIIFHWHIQVIVTPSKIQFKVTVIYYVGMFIIIICHQIFNDLLSPFFDLLLFNGIIIQRSQYNLYIKKYKHITLSIETKQKNKNTKYMTITFEYIKFGNQHYEKRKW